jgi:hypothetical protein
MTVLLRRGVWPESGICGEDFFDGGLALGCGDEQISKALRLLRLEGGASLQVVSAALLPYARYVSFGS